jgi:hypothetical protein
MKFTALKLNLQSNLRSKIAGRATTSTLLMVLLGSVVVVAGCSSNDTIKEDPAATKTRVDAATKLRSYFDKSNGNYDALSPEDKTAVNALTGGEKKTQEAFSHMGNPGGGAPKN